MNDISIISASYINEYKIEIEFNDGKKQIIDFENFLKVSKHPEVKKYLDLENFKKFQIVDGDLDWNDFDLTFPIWDLYTNNILRLSTHKGQEAS
jgi:hypothetical protein